MKAVQFYRNTLLKLTLMIFAISIITSCAAVEHCEKFDLQSSNPLDVGYLCKGKIGADIGNAADLYTIAAPESGQYNLRIACTNHGPFIVSIFGRLYDTSGNVISESNDFTSIDMFKIVTSDNLGKMRFDVQQTENPIAPNADQSGSSRYSCYFLKLDTVP